MTRHDRPRSAAADLRRDAWFLIPLVAGATMLLAATAFADDAADPATAPGGQAQTNEVGRGADADCVAAGGETVDGMPATQHQEQVLKDVDETDAEDLQALEPAAGCPDAGEMPATQHQEDVLEGDQGEDAAPAQ